MMSSETSSEKDVLFNNKFNYTLKKNNNVNTYI